MTNDLGTIDDFSLCEKKFQDFRMPGIGYGAASPVDGLWYARLGAAAPAKA